MTQYSSVNVKLSNSQLNNLKSARKNGTEVTLKLSSNILCDTNDYSNSPCKILLTGCQVSKVGKVFRNNSSVTIKLLETQLSKLAQSGISR